MIRKPAGDWQRESAAITAVRSAAKGTGVAARTGAHSLRGLVLGGFALLWGFAALAGGLIGGSLPTLFGVGAMALGAGWASKRAFAKARAAAGIVDAEPSRGGADLAPAGTVRTIRYARERLLTSAILSAGLGFACWIFRDATGGALYFLVVVGALLLGGFAILSVVKLFGDPVALRYDARTLTVATLWRRRTVAWSEVRNIGVDTVETYAAYGLLKTGSTELLVIHVPGGAFGNSKLSVAPKLLDMEGRTLTGLITELSVAWQGYGALPSQRGRAPAPAAPAMPMTAYPERDAPFDADAVMARYLAEKAQLEQQNAPAAIEAAAGMPVRRQFGRKGV